MVVGLLFNCVKWVLFKLLFEFNWLVFWHVAWFRLFFVYTLLIRIQQLTTKNDLCLFLRTLKEVFDTAERECDELLILICEGFLYTYFFSLAIRDLCGLITAFVNQLVESWHAWVLECAWNPRRSMNIYSLLTAIWPYISWMACWLHLDVQRSLGYSDGDAKIYISLDPTHVSLLTWCTVFQDSWSGLEWLSWHGSLPGA